MSNVEYRTTRLTQYSGGDDLEVECLTGVSMNIRAGNGVNGGDLSITNGLGGASGATGDVTITAPDEGQAPGNIQIKTNGVTYTWPNTASVPQINRPLQIVSGGGTASCQLQFKPIHYIEVYLAANQTGINAGDYVIFDSIGRSSNISYNTGTGVFTLQPDKIYLMWASITWATSPLSTATIENGWVQSPGNFYVSPSPTVTGLFVEGGTVPGTDTNASVMTMHSTYSGGATAVALYVNVASTPVIATAGSNVVIIECFF